MRRSALLLTFAVLPFFALCGAAAAQTPGGDTYPSLPPGQDRDLMIKTCSECHTPSQVDSQRGTLDDFKALIGRMQDNGLTASPEDLDKIAHYLAASFPPDKPK